jgi:hypothetical protein
MYTWAQPTAGLGLLGQVAQHTGWLGMGWQPTVKTWEGKSPPTPAAHRPNSVGRSAAVGRWGSSQGVNPVDGDPDLG